MKNVNKIVSVLLCTGALATSCSEEQLQNDLQNKTDKVVAPESSKINRVEGALSLELSDELIQALNAPSRKSSTPFIGVDAVDEVTRSHKGMALVRIFKPVEKLKAKHEAAGLHRWYRLVFDKSMDVDSTMAAYKGLDGVLTVEPVYEVQTLNGATTPLDEQISRASDALELPFNDPRLGQQWHYDHGELEMPEYGGIGLFKGWQVTAGKPNVIVAVLDKGVDYHHEDLESNMWVNEAELNGKPNYDDDQNGFVDDVHGYNFFRDTGKIDIGDHGTHVAGTIAAVNNNGTGVCGVAGGSGHGDGARIMTCQIGNDYNIDNYENAFVYAADNGATIASCSWIASDTKVLQIAVDYFVENAGGEFDSPMKGGLIVGGAGNDNIDRPNYPAAYDNTLAVAAVTHMNQRSDYSNFGEWINISAPGGVGQLQGSREYQILSTLPNSRYGYMSGTSMATPHVSGLAALILSKYGSPDYTVEQLINHIYASALSLEETEPSKHHLMGAGTIRADRALWNPDTEAPAEVNDMKATFRNGELTLEWTVTADKNDGQADHFALAFSGSPDKHVAVIPDAKVDVTNQEAGDKISATFDMEDVDAPFVYVTIEAVDTWGNRSDKMVQKVYLLKLDQRDMLAYPSPFKTDLMVAWGAGFSQMKEIELYDQLGRRVFQMTEKTLDPIALDLAHLATGRYTLVFKSGGYERKQTVLKVK